jgi:hypothetical protein
VRARCLRDSDLILSAIIAAGGAYTVHAVDSSTSGAQIELWQVINLVGAPLLAVLFARPVIDDLRAWHASRREEPD